MQRIRYVQELGTTLAPLSAKQHLAAIKHWFDWLVTGHVLEVNPAHAVRGPRYSQNTGKTPIVERDEARALLHSIDAEFAVLREADEATATSPCPSPSRSRRVESARSNGGTRVVSLRDTALIALMLFSWARIGAVVQLKVRDYRGAGTPRASLLLHEKNGKDHVVPLHHKAAEYLDAYLALAGPALMPDAPLWQNAPGHGRALFGRGSLGARGARYRQAPLPRHRASPGHMQSHVSCLGHDPVHGCRRRHRNRAPARGSRNRQDDAGL
ncbi:MAG TPA: hypothetical protein VH062_20400 [Polyangiaceae bacterium]|nr:hypothetical protein [Polyangiaceae bacterium]